MTRCSIRTSRSVAPLLLGAAAALLSSYGARGQVAPAGATQAVPDPVGAAAHSSAAALIDGGERPDLFLMYTGDVIGYLDPCG
jgi:hypothetical protein